MGNSPAVTETNKLTLLAGEDELAGVKTLRSADEGVDSLESVGILELDLGNRGTSARVVADLLHDALNVAVSLGEVLSLVSDRTLASSGVGLVDGSLSLTTTSNDLSHFESIVRNINVQRKSTS